MENKRQVRQRRCLQLQTRCDETWQRQKVSVRPLARQKKSGKNTSKRRTHRGISSSGKKFQKSATTDEAPLPWCGISRSWVVYLRTLILCCEIQSDQYSTKAEDPRDPILDSGILQPLHVQSQKDGKTKEGCSCGQQRVFLHAGKSQQSKQKINEGRKKTGEGSTAMVRNVKKSGCVSQDIGSSSQSSLTSLLKKGRRSWRSDIRLWYSSAAARSTKNHENQGPSLAVTQTSHLHGRSFSVPMFEGRFQEQTQKTRAMGSQRSTGLGKACV